MYDAPAGSALWDFALAAYARPGVAPLCLELQDRHGANVMLLLHLCHMAATGHEQVSITEVAAAMAPLESHLVAPLRRARRALSMASDALGCEDLRAAAKRLLRAELAAERLQCLRVGSPPHGSVGPGEARSAAVRLLVSYLLLLHDEGWQQDAAMALSDAVFAV